MIKINVFVLKGKHILAVALLLLVGAAVLVSTQGMTVFKAGKRSLPIYSADSQDNVCAVTFNCAWGNGDIDKILATLEEYNSKATFFIVGDWAEKFPDDLKKIHKAGHEIGTHSYDHKDYTKLSDEEIIEDVKKCDNIISEITGITPKLVRVPSGAYDSRVIDTLEKQGKICIQWSCDSIDYNDASAEDIYNRSILLEQGGILLMHTGTKNTALALPRVLSNLTGRFKTVTISELIPTTDFSIDSNGTVHFN